MPDWISNIEWMEFAKFIATICAPFVVALLGFIAFSAQKRIEKDNQLRDSRQDLYLNILGNLRNKDSQENFSTLDALFPYLDELRLVAPDEVVRKALRLVSVSIEGDAVALREFGGKAYSDEELDVYYREVKPMRTARMELLVAMRRDILLGSKVSPKVTQVEEL